MTTSHGGRADPRYVNRHHPRAMLHAWAGGDEQSLTMDMGGWTDDHEQAFEAAVRYELRSGSGTDEGIVRIHRVERDKGGALRCCAGI